MPSTYTLISSNVLTSSAASVTFSAIPSTYTDLVLRWSARNTGTVHDGRIEFNADSTTKYSLTELRGYESGVISFNRLNETFLQESFFTNRSNQTADTFSNGEMYLPNYLSTTSKPSSVYVVAENNGDPWGINATANLYRNTSAITSIKMSADSLSFASGSSFYLYGIKNS